MAPSITGYLFILFLILTPLERAPEEEAVRPVVVELFTSQSCSACPEANRNLIDLADEEELIVLTFSVDYWDYLGWHDTYAKPAFADRQRAYAERFGLRGPYTPQTVYDGRLQCSAREKAQMQDRVTAARRKPAPVLPVTVVQSPDGQVQVLIGEIPGVEAARVQVIDYMPGAVPVTPGGGDNAGMVMAHQNMVTGLRTLDPYTGTATRFDLQCDTACAILVDTPDHGIVGAVAYEPS